jgi:hypothetical protein
VALLNYTTTVAVEKTLGEIQRTLTAGGARSILIEYDERGNPTGLAFSVTTSVAEEAYRLPANIDGVLRTLTRQHDRGLVQPRFVTREQAARVGWRILKDWIEAQMAIIASGMVTLDAVMLPWMIAPSGQTVHQVYSERRLALPPPAAERG